jgi:hypothetical protein
MYNRISVNATTAAEGRREANKTDDGYSLLAAEIVIHAIDDWRTLISRRAWAGHMVYFNNFEELRRFFQSEWCDFLMQNFDVEPDALLQLLEKELEEAKRKEQLEQSEAIKEAKA